MPSKKYDTSKTAKALGYSNNKDVKFKYLTGIHIQNFRSLKNRDLKLGKYLTVITGKNGTMKSSLLGLIAHPFSSPTDAKDLYGNDLKTDMKNVFRLSPEKDKNEYIYYIQAVTTKDEELSEPVRVYFRNSPNEKNPRHRVTVGADNTPGKGNFYLNTSMINLSRLFPMIETKTQVIKDNLTNQEKKEISETYMRIMQRDAFNDFETVSDNHSKNTCGPKNSYYDFNSISSGEDNLGSILYKLIAFKRAKSSDDCLQGLICIDEFEASLHPVSQIRFFDFLLHWAKKNHMQIILTTHSLYLLFHCLSLQNKAKTPDEIVVNNISTRQVGNDHNFHFIVNPNYNTIFQELTFHTPEEEHPFKVNIICEDDEAIRILKKVLGRKITPLIEFIPNISGGKGTSSNALISLAKNGIRLLDDSIIVLDADVPENRFDKLKFKHILKIWDSDDCCLEKRLAYFVWHLDGADSLFSKSEKYSIMGELSDAGITQDVINDIQTLKNTSVEPYKKWKSSNKSFYNSAFNAYYHSYKKEFEPFKQNLVSMINEILASKGLPPV